MHSNDMKNIFLAGLSNLPAILVAIDTKMLITIISAIVLPILFFAVGKTVDVCLQIHFKRKERLTALLIEKEAAKLAKEANDEN